ncbi:MAG: hypothetical protein U0L09_10400, partial [Christensenellales bacterium]|nr:hypothetical protein [Christensenellales bacterium]
KEASCDGEAMVKAAAEAGYTLTIPEAERFMAEYQTLDDEALQMVVGGDCPWCGVGCFLTSSPNDRSAGGSCWTDYNCLILFLESAID